MLGCWCSLHCTSILFWEASYWPCPLAAGGSQDSFSILSPMLLLTFLPVWTNISQLFANCSTSFKRQVYSQTALMSSAPMIAKKNHEHKQNQQVLTTADLWNTIFNRLRMWINVKPKFGPLQDGPSPESPAKQVLRDPNCSANISISRHFSLWSFIHTNIALSSQNGILTPATKVVYHLNVVLRWYNPFKTLKD